MKRFLFLLIALSSLFVSCGTIKEIVTNPINIEKVVNFDNSSKDDLFVKANITAVKLFNKSSYVIEYADKEAGIICGKFNTSVMNGYREANVKVNFLIETKTDKVKFSFYDAYELSNNGFIFGLIASDEPLGILTIADCEELIRKFEKGIKNISFDW